MEKIHFSIIINAPKEKVWHTMLDDKTYQEWTKVFNPGSYFKGDWSKGSKMIFLGPDPVTGKEGGMVSRIAENRPYEFISIKHLGIIKDGVEDTTSEEAIKWAPAFENYTFKERDGQTEVLVDMDTAEEYKEMFEQMWPEALKSLKEIAEGRKPQTITVSTIVRASMAKVWEYWNKPEHIMNWAFASDDWEAPAAENDLKVGGKFKTVMAAKDGSSKFDFTGAYTAVKENELIEYDMSDPVKDVKSTATSHGASARHVKVQFNQIPEGVGIIETFDPESENPEEMQRQGWQAILNNFKKYAESK